MPAGLALVQLPKCSLPHVVIRTTLHHTNVTSNLLRQTVWLLSTTTTTSTIIDSYVEECFAYVSTKLSGS